MVTAGTDCRSGLKIGAGLGGTGGASSELAFLDCIAVQEKRFSFELPVPGLFGLPPSALL